MSDNKVTMVDNPMKDGKNIELTNANNDDDDDGIFDEDVVTVDEDTLGEEINKTYYDHGWSCWHTTWF